MKLNTLLSFILLNFIMFTASAQTTIKVGFADIDYILGNMPETTKVQEELDAIMAKLQKTRDSLVTDFNVKIENYKKEEPTLSAAVKKEKETNFIRIQQGIQGMESDMQKAVNYKKNVLLKPIYTRIGKLITMVAKEHKYSHIINNQINGNSVILYAEETTDISDLVIAKAKL